MIYTLADGCWQMDRWLRGPSEILDQAILHFRKQTPKDDRFAIIHTDNAIELLMRSYLIRKKRVLNKHNSAEIRFPELVRILRENAPDSISFEDVDSILFFHEIRNVLYHETDVLTVRRDDAQTYLSVAISLLEKLFDSKPDLGTKSFLETRLAMESNASLRYYQKILEPEIVSKLLEHISFQVPLAVRQETGSSVPLKVRGLSYTFPGSQISLVKDLTFALDRRGILVIRGPNGAGKTTLVKLLTGELQHDSGEITILGVSDRHSRFSMTRPNWVYALSMGNTIGEILDLHAEHFGVDPAVHRTKFSELVTDCFPEGKLDELSTQFGWLSGGEKSLAILVSVASLEPSILLADDFLTYLSKSSEERICRMFERTVSKSESAVVLVSHRSLPIKNASEIARDGTGVFSFASRAVVS